MDTDGYTQIIVYNKHTTTRFFEKEGKEFRVLFLSLNMLYENIYISHIMFLKEGMSITLTLETNSDFVIFVNKLISTPELDSDYEYNSLHIKNHNQMITFSIVNAFLITLPLENCISMFSNLHTAFVQNMFNTMGNT